MQLHIPPCGGLSPHFQNRENSSSHVTEFPIQEPHFPHIEEVGPTFFTGTFPKSLRLRLKAPEPGDFIPRLGAFVYSPCLIRIELLQFGVYLSLMVVKPGRFALETPRIMA